MLYHSSVLYVIKSLHGDLCRKINESMNIHNVVFYFIWINRKLLWFISDKRMFFLWIKILVKPHTRPSVILRFVAFNLSITWIPSISTHFIYFVIFLRGCFDEEKSYIESYFKLFAIQLELGVISEVLILFLLFLFQLLSLEDPFFIIFFLFTW